MAATWSNRMYLKPVSKSGLELRPNIEDKVFEIIEFEVDGEVTNRVKKPVEDVAIYVERFYNQYGWRGQAYIIKQSKMNFRSLINENGND